MKDDWKTLDTDLLVIGGGVAGCMAAIPALEAGLKVVICEKGRVLDHTGSVGCGVDQYLTIMESGPEWDTPEFLMKHVPELTDHIVDMAVTGKVINEMPRVLKKIESFGVDFKDPERGDYWRLRSFGLPGTYHINFDGGNFKKLIGQQVRRGHATVLMRTMGVQVLVEDNRVYGALAFNFRTGEWFAIRAKAVMLATGDVNRISKNASGVAFDSWHCPFNTGDAQAMGYRAGAQLANMEFVEATLSPKGFSTQGLNALVSLGAHFLNKHGERFMFKYDKSGENARRAVIADAVINEYLMGNGPVYVDCSVLPKKELDFLAETLQVDRYTVPAFYEQKKHDFKTDPVEVSISELSIRRSGVYFRGSGLTVDTNGETSISGLFSGGDCATVSGGISGAAVLGFIAGESATRAIRSYAGSLPDIDPEAADATRAEAMAHLSVKNGISWKDFESRTRQTVTDHVGFRRTEKGLRMALDTLMALARKEPQLEADDLHGLMRVTESRNIRLNAEIMATASIPRHETRTGTTHWRMDYPETDEKNWRKFIIVEKGENGPALRMLESSRPLSSAFSRNISKGVAA
jgi:adenylylsulfate reductase subunit A